MSKSKSKSKNTRKTKRLKKKSYRKRGYKRRYKKRSKKRRNLRAGAGTSPEPKKRNKLEAAQVRLAFAKMLLSESDLINDIILRIGSYLDDKLLNVVSPLEDKWTAWKERNYPGAPDLNIREEETGSMVLFNFDNIEVGRKFKFTAANYRSGGYEIAKYGACTIKNIRARGDEDQFVITLEFEDIGRELDVRPAGVELAEMRSASVVYNKPESSAVQNLDKEPNWSVHLRTLPGTLISFGDINT